MACCNRTAQHHSAGNVVKSHNPACLQSPHTLLPLLLLSCINFVYFRDWSSMTMTSMK
jgi:hypothetical protein